MEKGGALGRVILIGDLTQLEIEVKLLQRVDDPVAFCQEGGKLVLLLGHAAGAAFHERRIQIDAYQDQDG